MAEKVYDTTYSGPLYVRPVGRGIVLEGIAERPHIDEWLESALVEAGILQPGDEWSGGGRTTDPVTLTVRIDRAVAE